ncbi:TolC family protein [Porphyromonadaceae bacterium]
MNRILNTSITLFLLIAVGSMTTAKAEKLNLEKAIELAHKQSVDAAVALNRLKSAYWQYRTFRADQLPELGFMGTLPSYTQAYNPYQLPDGSYSYVLANSLSMRGMLSIDQQIALTGGKLSLNTSLDFTRQMGANAKSEFMSVPISLTLQQPLFAVNHYKWNRKIEPVRYKEAKANYVQQTEEVTMRAIAYFFDWILAIENLSATRQNSANATKLYEIAIAKRKIGQLSESELMQLNLSDLQAKGLVTEAVSRLNATTFALKTFLGLEESTQLEPVLPKEIPEIRMMYNEVLDKAQTNNAFAKNILRRQLQADYDVATAKGNLRSIKLYATVGFTGMNSTISTAYNNLRNNAVAEVGVSFPILDWGKRRGQVKVAESNRELILSQTKQEEMQFNQDIFLLVENFNNQAGQLTIAEQADTIAHKRYNMAIETFMLGRINILDLNDAQKKKDDAKQKHIQEMYRYWTFFYNIRSVTLYDFQRQRELNVEFEQLVNR